MGDHSSFVNHGFARVDTGRSERRGFPEVIYCEGKTAQEVLAISKTLLAAHGVVLGTRASQEQFDLLVQEIPMARFNPRGRCLVIEERPLPKIDGIVGVLCAGTSDLKVAEEAVETLQVFGNRVEKFFDVGVAGIHRLIAERDGIEACNVLVVVAGMEGALPSAVAGLVSKPIVAVPTSVGYGASFGGLAALLGMLNSCGSGVTVVNIDNGFGAAYAAATINRLAHQAARKGQS
jgi:NCAIR mutase (PurE)-related protein